MVKLFQSISINKVNQRHTLLEGYKSLIRHYLARFKPKEKCYGKQVHTIEKLLNLLIAKLNNQLPILF
jgi:insertion element IS1 protein InsB